MTLNRNDIRVGLQFVYPLDRDLIYTIWKMDGEEVHCTNTISEVDYVYNLTSLVSYFSSYSLLPVWTNS